MKHASGFASRLLLVCVVVILTAGLTSTAWGQLLFEDNFNYTSGTLLTANGWTAHSGGGTNAQLVTNYGLTYPGYASSGIGFADSVRNTGEDDNRTFT